MRFVYMLVHPLLCNVSVVDSCLDATSPSHKSTICFIMLVKQITRMQVESNHINMHHEHGLSEPTIIVS